MNEKLKAQFKDDVKNLERELAAFEAGEIDRRTYKTISGAFGTYAQRTEGNMLRLRIPGGRLTKQKLAFLAGMIETYQIDCIKMTSVQNIQLHNLSRETVLEIMQKAMDADIITYGCGGNYFRNVMASPLSGVEKGEYFDVMPWAEAASDYTLSRLRDVHLPRKLKIAFSNGPDNTTHATFRDLGFAARTDGTFDVYCAGGLGPNPRLGIKVAEAMAPETIPACIDAMVSVFTTFGNYQKRLLARSRYLQQTLGIEKLKTEYAKALEETLKTSPRLPKELSLFEKLYLPFPQKESSTSLDNSSLYIKDSHMYKGDYFQHNGTGSMPDENSVPDEKLLTAKKGISLGHEMNHPRIIHQKQPGLYTVKYHPIGGLLPPAFPERLYQTIKDMPYVEGRISPDGTLYLIHLTAEEADCVLAITEDSGVTPLECSTCCIGASLCQHGIRDSQALLKEIIKATDKAGIPADALPSLHISGCPSSCGTHQTNIIGFQGGTKLADGQPMPAFVLIFNGCARQGEENLGETLGTIFQEEIPEFMVELGQMVANSGQDFHTWIASNEISFRKLASKYIDRQTVGLTEQQRN